MKTKFSFVTNSSSTNYIIAVKKSFWKSLDKNNPLIKAGMDFISTFGFDGEASDKKELDEYILKRFEEYDSIEELLKEYEWGSDLYNILLKLIEDGYKLHAKYYDYNDEGKIGEMFINAMKNDKSKNIIIEGCW